MVRACLFGLAGDVSSKIDPGKCYLKLGLAYAIAGDSHSALLYYATAQNQLGPNTNMRFLCVIEIARESLKLEDCDLNEVEASLMSTISKLLGVQDVRSALLAAECCALLGGLK